MKEAKNEKDEVIKVTPEMKASILLGMKEDWRLATDAQGEDKKGDVFAVAKVNIVAMENTELSLVLAESDASKATEWIPPIEPFIGSPLFPRNLCGEDGTPGPAKKSNKTVWGFSVPPVTRLAAGARHSCALSRSVAYSSFLPLSFLRIT